MRISRSTSRYDCGPYNNIFDPINEIIDAIFQERLAVDAPGIEFKTYVRMKETEKQIINFAKNHNGDIGIVVGVTGIGKSTVMKYVREKIWLDPRQLCRVLFRDLSDESFDERLGIDFHQLELDRQVNRAAIIATEIINEMITKDLHKNNFYIQRLKGESVAFREFVTTFFSEKIPAEGLAFDCSDTMFVNALLKNHPIFLRLAFCYMLRVLKTPHVKIVFDNTDDKDGILVNALAEGLANLHKFIERFSIEEQKIDSTAPIRRASAFISCRPTTYEIIQRMRVSRNGGGSYGQTELAIPESVPLCPVIIARYEAIVELLRSKPELPQSTQDALDALFKEPLPETLRITIGTQTWKVSNYDSFFRRIFLLFDKSKQARELQQLCNFNVADSMKATLQVLRNRHFINVESLFAVVASTPSKQIERATSPEFRQMFTSTTILRALAYGNQGITDYPHYPIENTRIPNILHSERAPVHVTTFKARIISLYFNRVASKTHLLASEKIRCQQLVEWGERWFKLNKDDAVAVIDEMFREQLVANTRSALLPSECGSLCELHLTPRAWVLWDHLRTDSVLMECYRDEIELDKTLLWNGEAANWPDVATRRLGVNERNDQMCWVIFQVWNSEKSQGDSLVSSGEYLKYEEIFGDGLIAGVLSEGLVASHSKFYSKHVEYHDQGIAGKLAGLGNEMRTVTDGWKRGETSAHSLSTSVDGR